MLHSLRFVHCMMAFFRTYICPWPYAYWVSYIFFTPSLSPYFRTLPLTPTIAVTSFLVYLLRISPLYIRALNLPSVSLMPFPPPSPPLALQCTSRSPHRCPPPWCGVVPKPPTITTALVVVGITTNAPKTLTLHPASNDAHVSLVLLLLYLAAAETFKMPPKRLRQQRKRSYRTPRFESYVSLRDGSLASVVWETEGRRGNILPAAICRLPL